MSSSDHDAKADYDLQRVLDTHRFGGGMLRDKARAVLEDWLPAVYRRMNEPDIATSTLLEMGKVLIELGDMKPKANAQIAMPTGPALTISINIPSTGAAPPQVIEAKFTTPEPPKVEPDVTAPVPAAPAMIRDLPKPTLTYSFNVNNELMYDDPES